VPFLKKVVVGEDEDAIAHLISATLGDAGWLCLRARDGEAALELARHEAPDLIVLDVLMPRLDGFETVKRLKADPVHSKVPVLMLTSLSAVEDRVRGLEAGADDYLGKPFDLRELQARAQALVRASRRERDRSPTTDLPGPLALDEAVEARLGAGEALALVFVEADGFSRLTQAEGWARGRVLMQALATALAQATAGRADVLLVHLGGDDFALLAPAASARELAEAVRGAADGALRGHGLRAEVTVVDGEGGQGARTAGDLQAAVARARRRSG
jgi:two-component system OmpR family response regulator